MATSVAAATGRSMIKLSHFRGESEAGPTVIPLFGPADSTFEKVASYTLLPDVVRYIGDLRPSHNSQYVLVNAMGATEWWGSNVNGDSFKEASLIHRPENWTGNPLLDKVVARDWAYGFPTFYNAHAFAHHKNKDAGRAYGNVELAAWNPHMKRVELVIRVDKDKCEQFGGTAVWDRLRAGQYPDVSMGCRVKFDTCSICLDRELYNKAIASFNPKTQKAPDDAVIAMHERLKAHDGVGIRGVSKTRVDYCQHALKQMNKILPDGRKVWVDNDYPRFFDISFVFIGADKTAKVMMFIHGGKMKTSSQLADELGYIELVGGTEKVASVDDEILKMALLGKSAKSKKGEMKKDIVPSQFAGKAVPIISGKEKDLPDEVLEAMAKVPLERSLATASGLGMVLKPREFQRITLISISQRPMADQLDKDNKVFSPCDEEHPIGMSPKDFMPALARLLLPLMASRSALGEHVEKRAMEAFSSPAEIKDPPSSHSAEILRKISSAYNGYRRELMDLAAHSQELIPKAAMVAEAELHKLANATVEDTFTPLSIEYLQRAFLNERGVGHTTAEVVKQSTIRLTPACREVPLSVSTWNHRT